MSDKPINAMYGQKVKLDLNKLRSKSKTESKDKVVVEEIVEEPVVENKVPEAVVEETAEEPVVEEAPQVVDEEPVVEEVVEEEVPEEVVEESAEEPEVEEEVPEEVVAKPKQQDNSKNDRLIQKLQDKDKKLSNQSNELNYLTNTVIPKLKKENAELKDVKIELTDALEKTTRKYFDQLDINADLSNKIGKIGAENAVNKVRVDKLESEVDSIKEEYEAKLSDLENQIDTTDLDNVKKENSKLNKEIKELKDKLADSRKENINLSDEVDKLRAEIIEFGNYKEEVEAQSKKEVQGLNDELSDLRTQLKIKESSYDKLSNESGKTIADLRKQVAKLEEKLEKESNKGLFNRFK